MARSDEFDDDDLDANESDLVKRLRKQIKDVSKERDDALTEVTTLRPVVRSRSVVDVLTAKGVKAPDKVAKLLPDTVEPTADAIGAWLDDYADVLGVQSQAPSDGETPPPAGDGQPRTDGLQEGAPAQPFDAGVMAMLRQMDLSQATGLPAEANSAAMAKLADPNATKEDILALIANPGAA